jgi:hypothetical protein
MSFPRLPGLALVVVFCLPLMTTACGVPLAVTAVSYGADGASLVATGKSTTDHLISMTSEKDCALHRMVQGKAVCKEREDGKDPYDVDYSTPERMVSEDGVQFAPPLKPQAGAPATSWDAAAYKTAPLPEQPPVKPKGAEPVTAAADAAPSPVVAETTPIVADPVPPPAAKATKPRLAKKPKAKSRKSSPGPAASRS